MPEGIERGCTFQCLSCLEWATLWSIAPKDGCSVIIDPIEVVAQAKPPEAPGLQVYGTCFQGGANLHEVKSHWSHGSRP